ncbi:MAG: GDSL-type esterase/lipase family protein [Bacilli bacterium]|nr:GDSL-type esterase/lipase family protein [Bacilli bacterium]
MKIKTLLVATIIMLFVFLIYLTTLDKKIYYVSIGDDLALGTTPYGNTDYGYSDYVKDYLKSKNILETYVTEFSNANYRVTDFIKDIEANVKVEVNDKKQTIKNALIKADLITLSVGYNDLLYKVAINDIDKITLFEYVDGVMDDIDTFLSYVKEYCKEDVLVIGYYVPVIYKENTLINDYFTYANQKLTTLSNKYGMTFIDISDIGKDENLFSNPSSYYISKAGYELISKKILEEVNTKILQ